jgi:hypothetical protein
LKTTRIRSCPTMPSIGWESVATSSASFLKAVQGFDKVLINYPKGDKAPAAALKKGYSLLKPRTMTPVSASSPAYPEIPQFRFGSTRQDRLNSMGVSVSSTPTRRGADNFSYRRRCLESFSRPTVKTRCSLRPRRNQRVRDSAMSSVPFSFYFQSQRHRRKNGKFQ